jgi:hypothetical protein
METWTVELELALHARVRRWASRSQAELSAALDALREKGPAVLHVNPSWISIVSWEDLNQEVTTTAEFFIELSGTYISLSLRIFPGQYIVVSDARRAK